MSTAAASWSTQQLVEFLDALSSAKEVPVAAERAVERAGEALEAEIAALINEGDVTASIGFPGGHAPEQALVAATREGKPLVLEGLGPCTHLVAPVGEDGKQFLMVARLGEEAFSHEDLNVLRGMARVLDLTFRILHGLQEERDLRELAQWESRERERAERKYRTLVETMPAVVYTAEVGEVAYYRYVSPQVEQILGYTQEEWLADPHMWSNAIHPDDRERVVTDEANMVPQAEYRMIRKDGRVIWIVDHGVLEQDEDGTPYWHGVLFDVTKAKTAEEESQRLKNEFFALVSHELRTPLTSIIGYLDLLSNDEDAVTPKGQRSVEVIERNANRLLRLVGDLLFAAQVEAGSFEIEMDSMRPDELASESVEAAQPRAAARGIELSLDAARIPVCTGDGNRIAQAVDNLLSNALKFTPAGGRVDVAVRRGGEQLLISVKDTGIGIPAAEQHRLFERFYRSSNALSGSAEGAGLGMAIVKAIVEGHSGRISVQSEEGVGTEITIELPYIAWNDGSVPTARVLSAGAPAG